MISMNDTARLISEYAKNGVVSLSVLKKVNYPLFESFLNNYKTVLRELNQSGVRVINANLRMYRSDHISMYSFDG